MEDNANTIMARLAAASKYTTHPDHTPQGLRDRATKCIECVIAQLEGDASQRVITVAIPWDGKGLDCDVSILASQMLVASGLFESVECVGTDQRGEDTCSPIGPDGIVCDRVRLTRFPAQSNKNQMLV
jgi:hypothetical protein